MWLTRISNFSRRLFSDRGVGKLLFIQAVDKIKRKKLFVVDHPFASEQVVTPIRVLEETIDDGGVRCKERG